MEQSIEVGSIWIDKSGENPVIVLAHNKQRQSVSFTYLLTINGKLDLTEAFSSVDLFLKTKELTVASSTANTEYVKGKSDGYDEGYQHGFTLAKEKISKLDEKDSKRIYNDGYVKGHNDGWRGAVKAYSFGKPDDEVVDKLDKKYKEGYNKGYTQCIEDNSQRNKSEFVEVRQHHYDMGYNDALAYLASEEAEKELELKKQGYEEGYDGGFEDGYNTAIKEMKVDKFNSGVCGSNVPNKETQEAMQEVLDKSSSEFEGVWVAKDGSGKLKVSSINEGVCDVELVEHISNSFLCVGDTATISIDDLKEHWTKENPANEDNNNDVVNSPKHYNSDPSGVQCIEITRHRNNNIGNVIKYLWRNGLKDGNSNIQDLEKGAWYLNDEIQRLKGIRNGLE